MEDKYYEQAVTCVKDTVLPAQIKLYESCGGDLDTIYGEAINGNGYFGKVIEAGHIYELGYEKCTCPKVQSGQVTDLKPTMLRSTQYSFQNLHLKFAVRFHTAENKQDALSTAFALL